jgi:nucleoside-diphosphate-sugar epimerase
MNKKVFITGVAGYIGGSVAARFAQEGYQVSGLTRHDSNVNKLKAIGVDAIVGDLQETELLKECAGKADIVVNAADSDNQKVVETLLAALKGTDKVFIHTSGSSIVSDRANGERSEEIYDESIYDRGSYFCPDPLKEGRFAIDKMILQAANSGISTAVICPCLIYGAGKGIKSESQQIPNLIMEALETGQAKCIGEGENIWSIVHIDDLIDLYLKVAQEPATGSMGKFLFAENGETSFRAIGENIRRALDLAAPLAPWSVEDASAKLGFGAAVFGLGSNSRVRGVASRKLGWQPQEHDLAADILRSCTVMSRWA